MTVAHALTDVSKETLRIYMGLTDVNSLGSPVFAVSIHTHPEYNTINYNNDIALIKLQDPITFNSSIMPICLPAEGATYVTGVMGLVSGFGQTAEYNRQSSNKLKYVQIPVVDQETCNNSIPLSERTRNFQILTNNMFCAGLPEGGKDSCHGDNGGAFALRDDGRFWAAGIVNWGYGCGRQGRYGFYSRVANYVDWIKKTMQEN
ncbi:hypothetical protein EPR50_G00063010 [Perca flavescens]|uniref:Vitamin K-dependent protein C n=1 Tax=Perca flavescens TaxID=8167 RepID=A0A484D8B5_PERFV|nr:hypothetical protein EPR50_G00063010 [Perca flavescens]